MESLDNDALNELVVDGIAFMRSITKHYGSEKGMELYEKIMSTVDPEVKSKIFVTMLTGEHEIMIREIKVDGWFNPVSNSQPVAFSNERVIRIHRIRAVKDVTTWSLVDARNAVDSIDNGNSISLIIAPDSLYKDKPTALRMLKNLGFRI